ncbi:unnamed protein product [Commensalibacter communis]|uniref:Uncharacterized protein n=1 Tax=Commensalibacter communis TaxID=2972786 RepID=A0A9W4X7Y2_9PROT|nr:hypothetical protein [Commensalibacter communis]CAI3960627.1 unnamed protein product [Commensalibacter communis]CAI3962114.1 unnamed protein product [Commensalibacter communis]
MIEKFILLCSLYCEYKKISASTLSNRVLNNGSTLKKIIAGDSSMTYRKLQEAIKWLSDHWPEDQQWPDYIERPKERVEG